MERASFAIYRAALAIMAVFAAISVRAADVSHYSAAKGRQFVQTGDSAPQSQFYTFRATVEGNLAAITSAEIQPPGIFSSPFELDPNDAGTRLEFTFPVQDLSTLTMFFPNGNYTFSIDSDNSGFDIASLTINSSTFPSAIPQISNFTAAQSINAANAFTLNWNALGNASKFTLIVTSSDGSEEVLNIQGTGTSTIIPAGTLATDSTYNARLTFSTEVDNDTGSIPGAVGTAELFNETEFTIGTGDGNGGGGNDTTAPVLLITSPSSGQANVAVNAVISFTFSEPMAATQSIEWSANLNPANFIYAWGAGGHTLTATYNGNLPANSTLTWKLNPNPTNPANFKDVAGNLLPPNVFQGSFTTGTSTGGNDPCNGGTTPDDGRGSGSLTKTATFVQTSNSAPVPDTTPANFLGFYKGASNQNVTAVSLSGPAGNKSFQNTFGFFLLSEEFPSTVAVDTAYPAGNYTITATGAGSANVPVGRLADVPVPQIINFTALAGMNVANDFTLNFSPFTGAAGHDSIYISISGEAEGDGTFNAPDPCVPRDLPVTATSVVIPKNTFKTGKKYTGNITFSKSGGFDTTSIPGTSVYGQASVTTKFDFTVGGAQQPNQPRWTTIRRNADGTITFTITADAGVRLQIESSTSLNSWQPLTQATGTFDLTVDPRLAAHVLYRARVI